MKKMITQREKNILRIKMVKKKSKKKIIIAQKGSRYYLTSKLVKNHT